MQLFAITRATCATVPPLDAITSFIAKATNYPRTSIHLSTDTMTPEFPIIEPFRWLRTSKRRQFATYVSIDLSIFLSMTISNFVFTINLFITTTFFNIKWSLKSGKSTAIRGELNIWSEWTQSDEITRFNVHTRETGTTERMCANIVLIEWSRCAITFSWAITMPPKFGAEIDVLRLRRANRQCWRFIGDPLGQALCINYEP